MSGSSHLPVSILHASHSPAHCRRSQMQRIPQCPTTLRFLTSPASRQGPAGHQPVCSIDNFHQLLSGHHRQQGLMGSSMPTACPRCCPAAATAAWSVATTSMSQATLFSFPTRLARCTAGGTKQGQCGHTGWAGAMHCCRWSLQEQLAICVQGRARFWSTDIFVYLLLCMSLFISGGR